MKLLIADDELYMAEYIQKLVDWKEYGFDQVFTANGGSMARDILQEFVPELLITDIKMPRISGLDLSAFIEEKKYPTKVIIISGYSEFEYAKQALRYGVSEYLVKPVLKGDLEETLERILQKNFVKEKKKGEDKICLAGDKNALISYVKNYIYENFDQPLSLDVLGEAVHLHPAYLSKVFKEVTNRNVSGYITDIRMQKAAELLEQTELKIHEVMELIGYRKSQYFSRLFREKFGVTPVEYRRTVKKVPEEDHGPAVL